MSDKKEMLIVLSAILKNIIVIICFTLLSIEFQKWWIVLLSAILISDPYEVYEISNEENDDF